MIRQVTDVLVQMKDTFIKWPQTPEKLNSVKNGFYQTAGFTNVVGCINGTDMPIQAPGDDEASFVNRKGFYSIIVQGICDHNSKYMIEHFLLS